MKKLISLFLVLVAAFSYAAGDFYVDGSVAETGDGSQASPFKTVREGVVAAAAASGGTVHIAAGIYNVVSNDSWTASNDSYLDLSQPIELVGATGNPADVVIQNTNTVAGTYVDYARLVYMNNSGAKLSGITLDGGYVASVSQGGNVCMTAGLIEDCVIKRGGMAHNAAAGGNIYMSGGRLVRSVICSGAVGADNNKNEATGGSGIFATGNSIIENCLIYKNGVVGEMIRRGAYNRPGDQPLKGGYCAVRLNDHAKMINCTVAGNYSKFGIAGIYCIASTVRVINTAIYDNYSGDSPYSPAAVGGQTSGVFLNCASDVDNSVEGISVWTTPYFTDAANGDYTLSGLASPLANAGYSYEDTDAVSITDLAGNPRVSGDVDIGCYELIVQDVLEPTLTFGKVGNFPPVTVAYTAEVFQATGYVTCEWDFDNDGIVDSTTYATAADGKAVLIAEHVYSNQGAYICSYSVHDAGTGLNANYTSEEAVIVNGIYYADSDAVSNGDGTEASPFNNLVDLFSALHDGDGAKIRGTFYVGNQADALEVSVPNVVIDKWGDQKYNLRTVENPSHVATDSIILLSGANVVFSGAAISIDKAALYRQPIIKISAANNTVQDCDFELLNGPITSSESGKYSGGYAISCDSINHIYVMGCSFKNFIGEDRGLHPLSLPGYSTVSGCLFDGVGTVLTPMHGNNDYLTFVSNIVINASNTLDGDTPAISDHPSAGVLFAARHGYVSHCTIAFNRFVNTNMVERPACLLYYNGCVSSAGLKFYNNVVVGYDSVLKINKSRPNWFFEFANNVFCDVGAIVNDTGDNYEGYEEMDVVWGRGDNAQSKIVNNRHAGNYVLVGGEGYTGASLELNSNTSEAPIWVGVSESSLASRDNWIKYYRLRAGKKGDGWQYNAYTGSGYPDYLGALEPKAQNPFVISVR